jgi:pullulanase/glycogen debranching enzyme
MLLAGDEIGRTQKGNNNAYCQDNETSWINWNLDQPRQQLLDFTRFLTGLFRQHPSLRRRRFFHGRKIRGGEIKTLAGSGLMGKKWQIKIGVIQKRVASGSGSRVMLSRRLTSTAGESLTTLC